MLSFFRGRKRKFGAVTLASSCMLAVAWVRSEIILDLIRWNFEVCDCFASGYGQFSVSTGLPLKFDLKYLEWSAKPIREINRWELGNFGYSEFWIPDGVQKSLYVPYWSIVPPLTLLSAYLLLGKPKPTPTPPSPARCLKPAKSTP